jgi:hypothetical protein
MNGAGFRGSALGFKIGSINKLVDTKAQNGLGGYVIMFVGINQNTQI